MSRKKKLVVLSLLAAVFLLVLSSCNVKENVAEVVQKTESAQWFEDNLAWFIGIPSGTVLAVIGEFIYLFKKKKDYAKDLFQNNKTRKDISNFLTSAKQQGDKVEKVVDTVEAKVIKVENKLEEFDNKIDKISDNILQYVEENKTVNTKIETLIQMFALVVSKDEDLVASGIAEKINQLITKE